MICVLLSVKVVYADELGKESLKGLNGVYLIVERLNPDIEKDGLTKNSIKTAVELKLRMAGIKVLTKEEIFKDPDSPVLHVQVVSIKERTIDSFYAIGINIELYQHVFLIRDKSIIFHTATWCDKLVVMRLAKEVYSLKDVIKDRIDEFINDYLAVNPK